MSEKIEILSSDRIRVTRQAKILGFIDVGSVTVTEYQCYEGWWRDVATGERAEFWTGLDFDDLIDNKILAEKEAIRKREFLEKYGK